MIDLRSDTVTTPTEEMRRAMAEAEVGDDVYGEDPTVNRLQERSAEILGKEAGLFVPTGTMGNQVAVKLHTQPGQEVVVEERGHIYNYEMATMAALSGCLARPVRGERGLLSWGRIEAALAPPVYYRARTGLIALENTHNMAGGTVMTAQETKVITDQAHKRSIPVHLDGARIFNAAVALNTRVSELAGDCDSVMFCFSKGLSAPIGSMLVGKKEFIQEAWRVRKMMGGGMRQVGVLAAAALIALERMPCRLHEDHENAKRLARALAQLPAFQVDPATVETNILIADLSGWTSSQFLPRLKERGVLAGSTGPAQVRFVTHKDVSAADIDKAVEIIVDVCKGQGVF
ncbi:MAG: aminotransferase class I/II-fold pyridoxal phosphate-dependent enzyme [Acidobacteria bacterium]|nr:MAG: aminotransferase class I/II-fold pyridoxal phosphate-dependent enzyme [Acidobacteriota bacterium]